MPASRAVTVISPSGSNTLRLSLGKSGLFWTVKRKAVTVIKRSPLNLSVDHLDVTKKLTFLDKSSQSIKDKWQTYWGQQKTVIDSCNEATVRFGIENQGSVVSELVVVLRAYDDGIALRYALQHWGDDSPNVTIDGESVGLGLDPEATAWWIPAYQPDRYEYLYQKTAIEDIPIVHTPLTFKTPDGVYGSIHEAALYDYGSMVVRNDDGAVHSEITPLADGAAAHVTVPFWSPWRMIILGDTAADLAQSTMMLNLNERPDGDFSWVKPLKFMGIWWGMHVGDYTWSQGPRHGATTKRAKQYIDYCSKYNIQGLLIEGWNVGWDGNWMENGARFEFDRAMPDFDMGSVAAYARMKGVELIGHQETSGDVLHYEAQITAAFDYLQNHHIRYLKLGYVGSKMNHKELHHSQYGVRHYQKVVELAARYGVAVDIHEPIKGTGIERTWPNILTREGARGQEYEGGGINPEHVPTLIFTRMLAGPMDYTPGIFNVGNHQKRVASTIVRQLALYVVMYSPMQMVADEPENYETHQDLFRFIRDVPVNWNRTIVLEGEIGEYAIIARQERDSQDWYIGGVTNSEARVVNLKLDFLEQYEYYDARIYQDGPLAHWRDNQEDYRIYNRTVTAWDEIRVPMASGGGFAISLKKAKK